MSHELLSFLIDASAIVIVTFNAAVVIKAFNAAIVVETLNAIIDADMTEFVHIDMFEDEALLDNSSSQSFVFTLVDNNSGTHLIMKKRDSIKILRRYENMLI